VGRPAAYHLQGDLLKLSWINLRLQRLLTAIECQYQVALTSHYIWRCYMKLNKPSLCRFSRCSSLSMRASHSKRFLTKSKLEHLKTIDAHMPLLLLHMCQFLLLLSRQCPMRSAFVLHAAYHCKEICLYGSGCKGWLPAQQA